MKQVVTFRNLRNTRRLGGAREGGQIASSLLMEFQSS